MQGRGDTPRGLLLAHDDAEPLVFYGPPAALRGSLRLANATAEKIKLSRLALRAEGLVGVARAPLTELQISARLSPGEQGVAAGVVTLDPRTPPGSYPAQLTLGERTQPVVLHVVERIDLRVSPDVVRLFTDGERVFTRRFVVENAGNVPVRLGARCAALLVDRLEERSALREGGRRAVEEPESDALREVLGAWTRQQAGLVYLDRPDETLQPGEIRAGEATITLPEGLRAHHRYDAQLQLYNADVRLDVTTGALAESPA